MWYLPGPGIEPVSPALAGGFLTTAPPGKSLDLFFDWFVLFIPTYLSRICYVLGTGYIKVNKVQSLPSQSSESSAILFITVVTRTHIEHFHHPKSSNGLSWCSGREWYENASLKYSMRKYKNRVVYKVWQLSRGDTTYLLLQRSKGEMILKLNFYWLERFD